MRRYWRFAAVAALLAVVTIGATAEAAPALQTVDGAEQTAWVRHTVPLPKQIAIRQKVVVSPESVAIERPSGGDPLIGQTVTELREALGASAASSPTFTIRLNVGGAGAEAMKTLKNSGQAYSITPLSGNAGLAIDALTPRGLYYGVKTLKQLVAARAGAGSVEIPLATVKDWPDMEVRGFWGTDSADHVVWMSDRKMNIIEQISDIGIDDSGKAWGRAKAFNRPMFELGPTYAVDPVPVVLHLEQVSGKGVYANHPELKAKGGQEGSFCYSQPAIVDVIANWIIELAKLNGVRAVDVWMTENLHGQGGCRCDACGKEDYAVLEARAIVAGWEKAKKQFPELGLYTLTSEETEASNRKVFRMLPKDVRVWYYHSLLTYTANRQPMLRQYLADFAKQGGWIGVCPNVVYTIHFALPTTGAQFVHARMNEFVDKGMSGLLGYATPRLFYAFFNCEASAEWTWNAKGRSPREFALSWAVRNGLRDPEKFAEWSETLGPVSWDISGSHWPSGEQRNVPGKAAQRLKEGTLPPLGFILWDAFTHPWGNVKDEARLNQDVAMAAKAVELSKGLGRMDFYYESLIYQGLTDSLKALYELRKIVKPEGIAERDTETARRWFKGYVRGLKQAADVQPKWEALLPLADPELDFSARPVEAMNTMIAEMTQVAKDFGIDLSRP